MTASIVQSKHSDFISASATTIALTFDSDVTAGSCIYVFVVRAGSVAATCSDGNSYTEFGAQSGNSGGQYQTAFYYDNHAGGATTVTVTFGTSEPYRCMWIVEVADADTSGSIDQWRHDVISSPGTGTDAVATGNITPSQDNSLLLAWFSDSSGFGGTLTAGTGWTDEDHPGNDAGTAIGESKTQSTAAAINATCTSSLAHNYIGTIVSIKPSSSTIHEGAVGFDVDAGLALASDSILEVSASFASQVNQLQSADAILEAALPVDAVTELILVNDAILEAAFSEQVNADFSSTTGSIIEGALALAINTGDTFSANITIEGSLSLPVDVLQSQSADANLEASQTFANSLALSIVNDAVLAAGLTLDSIVDVTYSFPGVAVTVKTPDNRIITINAESRIEIINSESRTKTINLEDRTLKVH
jgi:hypothetical protein